MAERKNLLKFTDVALGYGHDIILSGLTWEIWEGDYMAVVGPNGCGKTTLLKAILGILRPRSGTIAKAANLTIGYVAQRESLNTLFPLTACEMVVMGLYHQIGPWQRPATQHLDKARKTLSEVGLPDKLDILYRDLSGGQKQRALLARALVSEPRLLLLDEPTSGMDIAGERIILELITDMARQKNITVVLVSHNLNLIAGYAKDVCVINSDGEFRYGENLKILEAHTLSQLYGRQVEVLDHDGQRLILVKEH